MRYEDDLWVCKQAQDEYDWRGYPQEQEATTTHFGKCFLSFNSAAQRVVLDDGKEYQYSFYAIAPLRKALYPLIPQSGERVIVKKADGTVLVAGGHDGRGQCNVCKTVWKDIRVPER